jgi:hypothetical protein
MAFRNLLVILLTSGLLLVALPTLAGWQGQNGVVRFSFAEGPELQNVTRVEAGENGVTTIDLYAWLTDVELLQKEGEAFLGLSAFELQLVIEGAEGFILKQEYPQATRQVGKKLGQCIVGLHPGLGLENGMTQLVHWEIMFQGPVEDVVFRLDPAGLFTCDRTPGCEGSGVSALYVGTRSSGFVGEVFGAGYQAAYLNPTGEPDLSVVNGTVSWQDVGEFQKR